MVREPRFILSRRQRGFTGGAPPIFFSRLYLEMNMYFTALVYYGLVWVMNVAGQTLLGNSSQPNMTATPNITAPPRATSGAGTIGFW